MRKRTNLLTFQNVLMASPPDRSSHTPQNQQGPMHSFKKLVRKKSKGLEPPLTSRNLRQPQQSCLPVGVFANSIGANKKTVSMAKLPLRSNATVSRTAFAKISFKSPKVQPKKQKEEQPIKDLMNMKQAQRARLQARLLEI